MRIRGRIGGVGAIEWEVHHIKQKKAPMRDG
jgi:hypothetical protein